MHLFALPVDPSKNYLPEDGSANYHGTITP